MSLSTINTRVFQAALPYTDWNAVANNFNQIVTAGGGSVPGAYQLWDSTVAGVGFPTASIDTGSLPQTTKHLLVVWQLGMAIGQVTYLQLNNRTNSWWGQALDATAGSVGAPTLGSLNGSLRVGIFSGSGVTPGEPQGGMILLPDYVSGAAYGGQVALAWYTGRYYSSGFIQHTLQFVGGMNAGDPGATTRLRLYSGGNYAQGRMTVYGLGAA